MKLTSDTNKEKKKRGDSPLFFLGAVFAATLKQGTKRQEIEGGKRKADNEQILDKKLYNPHWVPYSHLPVFVF